MNPNSGTSPHILLTVLIYIYTNNEFKANLASVQLVILDFYEPEETIWEALLLACKKNRVAEVASLLQKPLDPNRTGADSTFALSSSLRTP